MRGPRQICRTSSTCFENLGALFLQVRPEQFLCLVSRPDRPVLSPPRKSGMSSSIYCASWRSWSSGVYQWNSGASIGDAPHSLRIVGVSDDQRISLDHSAHGLAGLLRVLGWHGGDRRHEDPVHAFLRQVAEMSVDQFCRESRPCPTSLRRVRSRRSSWCWDLRASRWKSQGPQEGPPERHRLPECEHAGDPDGHVIRFLQEGSGWEYFLRSSFSPVAEQVRHRIGLLHRVLQFLPDLRIPGISQDLPPLAAVVGDPGIPVGEGQDGPLAVVGAERAGGVRLLAVGESVQVIQADERPVLRVSSDSAPLVISAIPMAPISPG